MYLDTFRAGRGRLRQPASLCDHQPKLLPDFLLIPPLPNFSLKKKVSVRPFFPGSRTTFHTLHRNQMNNYPSSKKLLSPSSQKYAISSVRERNCRIFLPAMLFPCVQGRTIDSDSIFLSQQTAVRHRHRFRRNSYADRNFRTRHTCRRSA